MNVLTPTPPAAPEEAGEHDPDEHKDTASAGTPHVLIIRTPDGLLTWLQALGSRRKADVGAGIPAAFSGLLMTDGYTGYQHLLSRLAGIQQCCQHYADIVVMPIPGRWRWRAGVPGLAVSA